MWLVTPNDQIRPTEVIAQLRINAIEVSILLQLTNAHNERENEKKIHNFIVKTSAPSQILCSPIIITPFK